MSRGTVEQINTIEAISSGRVVRPLLDQQDTTGSAPLHYACRSGQHRTLQYLLRLGASVRMKDRASENPLHCAAKFGRFNTAQHLVDSSKGFLILNESNVEGKTALHIASAAGHTSVVELLLSKGALLHRDHEGHTPLHLAAEGGHDDTCLALLAVHSHLLDQTDKDGNTALHLSVRGNHPACVTLLLNQGCRLLCNTTGNTPIELAIQHKRSEAAVAMVTHHRGPGEVLSRGGSPRDDVSLQLIRVLPKVFEAALNQAITKSNFKAHSEKYHVSYDFSPLYLNTEEQSSTLLACNAMVEYGRVDLLMHPLTQKFLEMKWDAYGKYVNAVYIVVFFVFLATLTTFSLELIEEARREAVWDKGHNTTVGGQQEETEFGGSMADYVMTFIIISYSCFGLLKEIHHFCRHPAKYVSEGLNMVEWLVYLPALCMVLMPVFEPYCLEHQVNASAMAVFCAWFTLLLYFQRFDLIGTYIVMFLEILKTLVRVLLVFSVLIVAFALSFFILLSQGNHLAYSTVPMSLIRVLSMMLGELDFINSFVNPFFELSSPRMDLRTLPYPNTTFVILLVFMVLMPILLMNLLIGLAVGDIEKAKKKAQMKRLAVQVHFHTSLEDALPSLLMKKLNKQELVVYPNNPSASLFDRLMRALIVYTPFHNTSLEEQESSQVHPLEQVRSEVAGVQRRMRGLASDVQQQTRLLALVVQSLDINTEVTEMDEGVYTEEVKRMLRRTSTNNRVG